MHGSSKGFAPAWTPRSWEERASRQQPSYSDEARLDAICAELTRLPPLVHRGETSLLRSLLADAAQGKRFVLQLGDCAERFANCMPSSIETCVGLVFEGAHHLELQLGIPVVRIGRIAGQYAKPRSHPMEERDGILLPVYRGDMVNDVEFSLDARTPDPERMLRAYQHAALTLNWCRAAIVGVVAEAHPSPSLDPASSRFFASHEALVLPYESALARHDESGRWWSGSAHFLWIGERTRQPDGAHVEFLRGLSNPVGVKVGPTATAEEVHALCRALNPNRESGRLVLVSRLGASRAEHLLPRLIEAAREHEVVWFCDPLHGNDVRLASGRKTRCVADVEAEILTTLHVHRTHGSRLAGLHLEATAEDVLECANEERAWLSGFSPRNFRSACDPRLNRRQTLRLLDAFAIDYAANQK